MHVLLLGGPSLPVAPHVPNVILVKGYTPEEKTSRGLCPESRNWLHCLRICRESTANSTAIPLVSSPNTDCDLFRVSATSSRNYNMARVTLYKAAAQY